MDKYCTICLVSVPYLGTDIARAKKGRGGYVDSLCAIRRGMEL